MKRLVILPIILFEIGCAGLPEKPKGDLCTLDIPNNIGRCAPISEGQSVEDLELKRMNRIIMQSSKMTYVPVPQMDHWVAFSPETWVNITVYIQKLKAIAEQKGAQ